MTSFKALVRSTIQIFSAILFLSAGLTSAATFETQINSSTDDAEEYTNGTVNTDSSDLGLAQDSSGKTIGMRFNNIALPADAVISSAYLQFQVDDATQDEQGVTLLTINGEANANPSSFSSTSNNITNRALTSAKSIWAPDLWPTPNAQGTAQRSRNLSAIIQELVSQSGWNSGQSIVFIIRGTAMGNRTAESFDGSPAGAPILHIEYSTNGNPVPVASFTTAPSIGHTPSNVDPFDGFDDDLDGGEKDMAWEEEKIRRALKAFIGSRL